MGSCRGALELTARLGLAVELVTCSEVNRQAAKTAGAQAVCGLTLELRKLLDQLELLGRGPSLCPLHFCPKATPQLLTLLIL